MDDQDDLILLGLLLIIVYLKRRHEHGVYDDKEIEHEQFEFTLDDWSDDDVRSLLGCTREEFYKLNDLLGIDFILWDNWLSIPFDLPLAALIIRLIYPRTWWKHSELLGRSASYLVTLTGGVLGFLDSRFVYMIDWHPTVDAARIEHFAHTLHTKGEGRGIFWGWIDGAFMEQCRPLPKRTFSGDEKRQAMKWQGLFSPDGLVFSLQGPWVGEADTNQMAEESCIGSKLGKVFQDKVVRYLHADNGYDKSVWVVPNRRAGEQAISVDERDFNRRMSKMRKPVRDFLASPTCLLMNETFAYASELGDGSLDRDCRVAVLLTNCYTCLRGNEISMLYDCEPPSIEEYLDYAEESQYWTNEYEKSRQEQA